jgi:hypothetical protein
MSSRADEAVAFIGNANMRTAALALMLALSACAPQTAPVLTSTTGVHLGAAQCDPESPRVPGNLGPDPIGTVQPPTASLFARMATPMHSGVPEKIIWRMTGSGALLLYAEHTDGTRVAPNDYGPHAGSTWQRPGDEFGSEFVLPKPGCWRFHLERSDTSGDVWVIVPAN